MSILQKLRSRYLDLVANDLRFVAIKVGKPKYVRVGGVKVPRDSTLYSSKVRMNLYRGTYERAEIAIITKNLADSDRVLEIGAGVGAVSALCALRVGGDQVRCVEANPVLEPLIRETHQLNAVSPELLIGLVDKEDGEGVLYADSNLTASSAYAQSADSHEVTVRKISISRLIREFRPTFLIVDIEGYEVELFDGVDLSGIEKMCIELHPDITGDQKCLELIKTLADQGLIVRLKEARERSYYFEREAA